MIERILLPENVHYKTFDLTLSDSIILQCEQVAQVQLCFLLFLRKFPCRVAFRTIFILLHSTQK